MPLVMGLDSPVTPPPPLTSFIGFRSRTLMPFLTRRRQAERITSMSFLTRRQRERITSMFGILVFMPNALPIRAPLIGFTMPFAQSQLLATLCGEPTGGTPARRLEKHHHSPQEQRRALMTNMAQNRSGGGRAFPRVARQSA